MIDRRPATRALTLSALGFVAAALVFSIWPGIDLAASAAFATPDGQFPARADPLLEIVRQFIWKSSYALIFLSLAMMMLQGLTRTGHRIATRIWSFIFLSYLLGPGLLVNGILKAHWGRARPYDTTAFGGEAAFTPALTPAEQCATNCSFVSGETAGVFTLALVLTLTFAAAMKPTRARRATLALVWTMVPAGATIRIASGAHFLSDVVFAICLTAMVIAALYLALGIERHLAGASPANVVRDLRDHLAAACTFVRRMAGRVF